MTIFRRFGFLLVLCAGCLTLPAQAATFKIATLSPEGSGWMKVLRKYGKRIEERTDGEVKFKFYPGGVMGDDKAVMRKMRVGQLHGAVVTSGGLAQVYPDIALYSMPMLFRSEAEIDHVRAALDSQLMAGLREEKYVGFGFAEVGFAYPMSQQPAVSVTAMRQRKVWTPDNDQASLEGFKAFDISPIPLPIADVLAGLQTGLIDSIASPPIGAIALQWHTQVDYALELPLLYIYGLFAMAERPFNRLSAEHQAVVSEEMQTAVKEVDAAARRDHNSAKAALSNQGIEWLQPGSEDTTEWITLADDARRDMVAGDYISAGLYQKTIDLLAEFRESGG